MKKILHFVLRLIAIASVISIPLTFLLSGSVLTAALDSILHLKINTAFSGGEVRARVYDPAGDDTGCGTLVYPRGAAESSGALDIIRYTVHEPLPNYYSEYDTPFWQIGVTLGSMPDPLSAPLGFSYPVILIYIDTDGDASGSVETAVPRAELVSFDPAHPWDVFVEIDGWHGQALLRTADGKTERRIHVIALPDKGMVYVRLPLDIPEITRILDNRPTWHYVFTAFYDSSSRGFVMPLAAEASQRSGGGSQGSLTPRVYDCLVPRGKKQKDMLSSWNEITFNSAVAFPVEIKKNINAARRDPEALRLEAEKERSVEMDKEKARLEAALPGSSGEERIALLFSLGRYEETEGLIQSLTAANSESAALLAYQASLQAMKAGKASDVAEAMNLVNAAFALFTKSESLCKNDDDRLTLSLNRGFVSMSVPEDVFRKSLSGAADFLAAAEILLKNPDRKNEAREALLNSMRCYERAGKPDEAERMLVKAASLSSESAQTAYELVRMGIELE